MPSEDVPADPEVVESNPKEKSHKRDQHGAVAGHICQEIVEFRENVKPDVGQGFGVDQFGAVLSPDLERWGVGGWRRGGEWGGWRVGLGLLVNGQKSTGIPQ